MLIMVKTTKVLGTTVRADTGPMLKSSLRAGRVVFFAPKLKRCCCCQDEPIPSIFASFRHYVEPRPGGGLVAAAQIFEAEKVEIVGGIFM